MRRPYTILLSARQSQTIYSDTMAAHSKNMHGDWQKDISECLDTGFRQHHFDAAVSVTQTQAKTEKWKTKVCYIPGMQLCFHKYTCIRTLYACRVDCYAEYNRRRGGLWECVLSVRSQLHAV